MTTQSPWELIERYEGSLADPERRGQGIHYTPRILAEYLSSSALDVAIERLGRTPVSVCDPACGAGSFLVATATALAERGVDPVEIVTNRLMGFDLDESAVETARQALMAWLEDAVGMDVLEANLSTVRPRVEVLDVLEPTALGGHGPFEMVIGNPPFLTQLRSGTAMQRKRMEALGDQIGELDPYVDASSLFVLLATLATRPCGVVTMILPQSFLSVRGSRSVRDHLIRSADLVSLWSSGSQFFDASVHVCAITVSPRKPLAQLSEGESCDSAGSTQNEGRTVDVNWGGSRTAMDDLQVTVVPEPGVGSSWGPMLAPSLGIPLVGDLGTSTHTVCLGELATATAGFRDEYYALAESCTETAAHLQDSELKLTTVGMIKPMGSDWGERASRIGGRSWQRPVVDPDLLAAQSQRVKTWVKARTVPKILVATQSRVVEAFVDLDGTSIPMTPVISIEPRPNWIDSTRASLGTDPTLWWILAAISAPPICAGALAENLGAGLSVESLRWSAKAVLQIPMPNEPAAWSKGADLAEQIAQAAPAERPELLERFGLVMCEAYRITDPQHLMDWWLPRAVRA